MEVIATRQERITRAVAVLALLAGILAIGPRASAQDPDPGAPILTDVGARGYVLEQYLIPVFEISWSVDPSGPAPTRYIVDYVVEGVPRTSVELGPDATWDGLIDVWWDQLIEATVTACAGPTEAEACASVTRSARTPERVEPHIEVVEVTATALSPTTIQVDWSAESNIGVAYSGVVFNSDDPPESVRFDLADRPLTWTRATPGATYQVGVTICGGPSPTSLQCAGNSTTVTMPPAAGVAGTIRDDAGQPVAGATVAAYAPSDGLIATARTTSAADGTYELDGLVAGEYAVVSRGPEGSLVGQSWYGGASRWAATLVTVEDGVVGSGIDLSLPVSAAISGTASFDGDPLTGEVVWAVGPDDVWVGTAVADIDYTGAFRLETLATGRYQLLLNPGFNRPWVWYGGSGRGDATWIEVTAGEEVTGIGIDASS